MTSDSDLDQRLLRVGPLRVDVHSICLTTRLTDQCMPREIAEESSNRGRDHMHSPVRPHFTVAFNCFRLILSDTTSEPALIVSLLFSSDRCEWLLVEVFDLFCL